MKWGGQPNFQEPSRVPHSWSCQRPSQDQWNIDKIQDSAQCTFPAVGELRS